MTPFVRKVALTIKVVSKDYNTQENTIELAEYETDEQFMRRAKALLDALRKEAS